MPAKEGEEEGRKGNEWMRQGWRQSLVLGGEYVRPLLAIAPATL